MLGCSKRLYPLPLFFVKAPVKARVQAELHSQLESCDRGLEEEVLKACLQAGMMAEVWVSLGLKATFRKPETRRVGEELLGGGCRSPVAQYFLPRKVEL